MLWGFLRRDPDNYRVEILEGGTGEVLLEIRCVVVVRCYGGRHFFCALFGSFFCWIVLYSYYLVYLQSKYDKIIMTMTKVIHVHLIIPKKNYYFGSITAIYTKLSEKEVGMTKNSLLHAGLSNGGCVLTKRALITQSHLIRCKEDGLNG